MQTTKKLIPKLRFPDFDADWKIDKLLNISNFWNGKGHEQEIDENGSYVVVNSKFVSTNGKVRKFSNSQNSPLKQGDIAIVMSDIPNGRAIARTFLVDEDQKYTLNQRIGGLHSEKVISPILSRLLNRNKYYLKFDNGVSQTNLRKDEVLGCPVIFPENREQQKIADFLGSVDEWIENLEKQREAIEAYKKGVMQKIFSQQIRFKNDNGKDFTEWKSCTLQDIVLFSKGKGISKNDVISNGKNKCIRYGELYTDYKECILQVLSETNLDKSDCVESKIGDVLVPSSGETAIDIATASYVGVASVLIGGDVNILSPKNNADGKFLAYFLAHYKKIDLARLAQGVSVFHLYSSNIKNLHFVVPCVEEQRKISEFLTSIDLLLQSKKSQITKAKQWKKGLLQQMFI